MRLPSFDARLSDRMTDQDAAKRAAGRHAATLVEPGMTVGLGTGSTTAFALEALGRRLRAEPGFHLTGTPTSYAAERLARRHAIPLAPLDDLSHLDLVLDGADEFDPHLDLIKGRGGAHTREKVVAALGRRFVVLADPSKAVDRLGARAPVPVEVLPMAVGPVGRALEALGARPVLREGAGKDGPVVTDQGFWLLDAHFPGGIDDADVLGRALNDLPGVLGHGLFVGLATDVLVGHADGRVDHRTRPR